jgi:dTDP-glucose pyrophosphorylase
VDKTHNDISELCIAPTQSVRDTIALIGANRGQIALVVDVQSRLLGVVTDGDVRRGILRGVDLDASVVEIMNSSPHVASENDTSATVIDTMREFTVRQVPVVGTDGAVISLFTLDNLKHPVHATTPVVLMAGGRGQRLFPLTKDVPKPMLPIGGVPLLEIILRNLAAQGFVNIYISVNYLADVIMQFVGDGSKFGLNVNYVHEEKPLGTAGALAALAGVITEPFIVMNSDLLTQVNLRELLSFHRKRGAKGTIGVREHVFEIPYGVVVLDGAFVQSMEEKPLHRSLVNAGIYALDPVALELLSLDEYLDMPTLLTQLMGRGHNVAAFPIHESWLDVGRPEDLDLAQSNSGKWINP